MENAVTSGEGPCAIKKSSTEATKIEGSREVTITGLLWFVFFNERMSELILKLEPFLKLK